MFKKQYLFLILLVCLFAVSAVSGAEIGNDTNMVANSDDSGLMAESVNENVLTVSLNEEEIQGSADNGTFTALQKKIDDAEEDSIIVLENDYTYDSGFSTDGIFINKTLTINGNGYVIDALGQSRIFYINFSAITLNNIIFKNGYTLDNGGAIYWSGENGTLFNCTFVNCFSAYGGAIYWGGDNGFLNNSQFYDNSAISNYPNDACFGGSIYWSGDNGVIFSNIFRDGFSIGRGAALYCACKKIYIFNTSFMNNSLIKEYLVSGGAIYLDDVNECNIVNSVFKDNFVDGNGGAIYSLANKINLINCTFVNNTANNGGAISFSNLHNCNISSEFINNTAKRGVGGAIIFLCSVSNSIISGEFINNTAESSAGSAIFFENSVYNSNISGNFIDNTAPRSMYTAWSSGGAICFDNIVSNCNILGNFIGNTASSEGSSCSYGGAIVFRNIVSNSSVCGEFINNVASSGGAIFISNSYTSNIKIINSVFNNNSANYCGAIRFLGYNCLINNSIFHNNVAEDSDVLYIGGNNNTIENLILINNSAKYGGFVEITSSNTKIINSLFECNNASAIGGAIQITGTNTIIDNTSFIDNIAHYGSAIHLYSKNGLINNSLFINNKGTDNGTIHIISDNVTVSNSILINNTYPYDIYSSVYSTVANNNWFGNTLDNQIIAPKVSSDVIIDNWHYLDLNTDSQTLKIGESAIINIDLNQLTNNEGKIGYNNELPDISVNITSLNGVCNVSTVKLKDGKSKITFTPENAGYGSVTINYLTVSQTIDFLIKDNRIDPNMTFNVENIPVGETVEIDAFLPSDATGNVVVTINNKTYSAKINKGEANILIKDLPINKYDFIMDYGGDTKYSFDHVNGSFLVSKVSDYNITAENLTIYGDQSAEIVVNVPSDATGNIVLYILSEEYVLPVIDGKATFVISDLSGHSMCGFIAVLMDDPKYELNSVYGTITILPKVSNYTISSPNVDVYCGETANITVYLPQDATGRLKVWYDGRDIGYAYIYEGVATFEATYQISCVHTYDFYYEGDYKYIPKSTSVILTVHKFSDYSFNTTDVYITAGETANIIANLPKDTSGTANIRVFNENFEYTDSTTVNEGQIVFNIDGLLKDAEFIIDYLGDYRYESKSVSGSIFVKSSIVINAPDVTKYYGGSEKFIVTLTDKNKPISNADVEITIDGETITRTTDSNGKIFVDLNQNRGTYVVTINYEDLSNTSKVIINPASTKTALSGVKNINVGDSLTVTATVNATVGSVTFKVGSNTQKVDIINNKASYTISSLSEGSYNIDVSYNDANGNYLSSSDSASFTVSKISPKLSVIAEDIGEGQDAIFEITTNEDCTGDINVLIDGKNFKNTLSNGKTIIKVPNLTTGDYNYTVSFLGDEKYGSKSIDGAINVKSINVILNAPDLVKYYGSKDKLSAQLLDKSNKPLSGQKIIFTVNGRDYERITDNSGIASMNINLISGNHIANVRFEGNGTYDAIKTTVQIQIKYTVSGNNVTKIFRNSTQYYAKFVDTNGNLMKNTDVEFNINGVFYTRTTNENGVAKMNINLPPGTYIITSENPNSKEKYTNLIKVLPSIVENYDLTKYYKNASKYTLRIIGDDGKPVGEGVTVKLNINGVFYERKTNATGYMNMNINLPPGTYTVTAEYNGLMASNKITVLSVLETHNLVMKYKDGSKFEAKILDGQGRPYAGQTVTFNINGVFYTKTTEADGIARLKINLLAGEYIITSMYNGLNSANKVTISG